MFSLRAQADKKAYPRYMQKVLKEQENLDIVEAMVEDLIVCDECMVLSLQMVHAMTSYYNSYW